MEGQLIKNKLMQDIQDEVRLYCDTEVWSIKWIDVQCWLNNFRDNPEHYYFAHLLLDKVIFRTNDMLESAYRRFLATTVRQKINEISKKTFSIEGFFSALSSGSNDILPYFRVTPIETDEKAESGGSLLRHINSKLINSKLNLNKELKRQKYESLQEDHLILIIDDFLGSGEQAEAFFKTHALEQQDSDYFKSHEKLMFAPSLAMTEGIINFKKQLPNIKLFPLEEICINQNVFAGGPDELFSRDPILTKQKAKECYEEVKNTHKFKIRDWFGRNESGLTVIFQLGVPNQSLALIFFKKGDWKSLQNRRAS